MKENRRRAFTLIELLMVIAIIGILAGILIPTVGAVKKQANIAASKSQMGQYLNAIQLFKGEYGYYPTFGGSGTEQILVSLETDSEEFIETLSGRDASTGESTATGGNRRAISFPFQSFRIDVGQQDPRTTPCKKRGEA